MNPHCINRKAIRIVAMLICATWLVSSSSMRILADDPQTYGPWATPVNLGPVVNSSYSDLQPCISKDGLSLYFVSKAPDPRSDFDIYVSQRASEKDPWGPPQVLGTNVNSLSDEGGPALSPDGHRLYFNSARPGGIGVPPSNDIYVSRRHNKRDDFGWQPAENLGSGVNATQNDVNPSIFEDDTTGTITLYFQSNRPGGLGSADIWASVLQPDDTFGTPVPVVELNSSVQDQGPCVRKDGLEIIITSSRPGGFGGLDLWVSTRPSTADPWSTPVNLGPVVNSAADDTHAALSFDGMIMYFMSGRPGFVIGPSPHVEDLWVSTRSKLKEQE